jgi:ribonuclease HI
MQRKQVIMYCDGSAHNSSKKGGYGYVGLRNGQIHMHGYAPGVLEGVTSNRMEMLAVLRGLEWWETQAFREKMDITVRCDSQYVVKGLSTWVKGWVARGWRTYDGGPVLNRIEWKTLINILERMRAGGHTVEFKWTKGHVEGQNPWNHVADFLAAYGRPAEVKEGLIRAVKLHGPDYVFTVTESGKERKPKAFKAQEKDIEL